jgi:hypothetical protein
LKKFKTSFPDSPLIENTTEMVQAIEKTKPVTIPEKDN